MRKKLIGLGFGLVIAMIFSIAACNLEDDGFAEYKAKAKATIETYAMEDDYTRENWQNIIGFIEKGKGAVETATTKSQVDTAVEAKKAINEIEKEVGAMNGAYFLSGNTEGYALLMGSMITISRTVPASQASAMNMVSDTFKVEFLGGFYVGENIRKSISYICSGDELIAHISWHGTAAEKLTFKKNVAIDLSSEISVQLEPPKSISSSSAGLMWQFADLIGLPESISSLLYQSGILGAGVEIKQAGKDYFEWVCIRDFIPEPANFFNVLFADLDLPQGTNIVRVFHLGGLYLHDDMIKTSENSKAIYYSVTVNVQGETIVEKI